MDNRQLNLNQPLLSVRRGSLMTPQPEFNHRKNNLHYKPTLPPLPYYKSDLKSGPIRNPGVVPFQWEQMPGQPKHEIILPKDNTHAPKLPPGRIKTPQDLPKDVSTTPGYPLSWVDSFYNCSVSGLSEVNNSNTECSGTFSDPQTRDFMMGRFLPAAKAVAEETPNFVSRKYPSVKEEVKPAMKVVKLKEQGPHCTWPRNVHGNDEHKHEMEEEEEDDEDEDDGVNDMSAKLCGLLPKFCILNPIPGMRDHSQAMSSFRSVRTRPTNAESCRKTENKLDRRNNHVGDMKRMLHQPVPTNEPPRNAISGRRSLTSIKPRSPQMLFDKEKRFLSLPEECRDLKISKLDLNNHSAQETTTPPSSTAFEKTLYVDQEAVEQSRNSISSSSDSRGRNPSVDSLQDIKSISGWDEKQIYQPKSSESSVKSFQDILLLGPALPRSPSESWLSRTLPSMSSKNPTSKSYLGNLAYRSSPVNAKCERMSRSPNFQHMMFRPAKELGPILEN